MHDQLLGSRPEGASHNAEICQFCVADKATQAEPTVPDPSRSTRGPDVSDDNPTTPEGRDTNPMTDTISTETHEALVKTKVADAVAATEAALATKTQEAASEKARADKAETELETVKADNAKINGELDTATLNLKAAQDKASQLEADLAAKDEASAKEKLATERASQVRNLKVFEDSYVDERASIWADVAEADWNARLDEWAKIRPASTEPANTDAASAMTGTTGDLTKEPEKGTDAAADSKPSARRAVLGLASA